MTNVASPDRQKQIQEGVEEKENDRETLEKIRGHIRECRTALQRSQFISAATRASYESMFEGYIAERQLEFAKTSIGFVDETISRAKNEYDAMMDVLKEKKGKLLGDKDMEAMQRWFFGEGMLDMVRSDTWKEKLDRFVKRHEAVEKRRVALLKRMEDLKADDVEGFALLKNPGTFAALGYAQKKSLLDRLEALDLASAGGKKKLFAETKNLLSAASTGEDRYVAPGMTGGMLKRMMEAAKPERYREDVLLPSLGKYRETRMSFDALQEEWDADLMTAPKLDTFLRWDAGKRSSFLEEGKRRLSARDAEEESQENELKDAKRTIEHCMRKEEWDRALALLEEARSAHPEDRDLAVMLAYAGEHGVNAKEEHPETADDAREEIRALLEQLPPSVRDVYAAAAEQGHDAFVAFTHSMERGIDEADEAPEEEHPESRLQAEEGGDNEPEEEAEAVVRDGDGGDERMEAVQRATHDGDNRMALRLDVLSKDTQALYRQQINEPLLQALRKAEDTEKAKRKAA